MNKLSFKKLVWETIVYTPIIIALQGIMTCNADVNILEKLMSCNVDISILHIVETGLLFVFGYSVAHTFLNWRHLKKRKQNE